MSQIRKKSLITASWIYIGFFIGAINTVLFAKKGFFTTEDYGLSRSLLDIGFLLSSFSAFGTFSLLVKFHPYYEKRLPPKQNDLFSIAVILAAAGFSLVSLTAFFFEPFIVRKFNANAPTLIHYFYWSLFLAFGILSYSILEYHAWNFRKQIMTNILKEIILRLFVLTLIILKLFNYITLHQFFVLFCFQYLFISSILLIELLRIKKINLIFSISPVTKKFKRQISAFMLYGIAGSVTGALRVAIDSIVLAGLQGLSTAGVYTLASFAASLLQAPYRSLVSITYPLLSQAWKDKNLSEIDRIYKRSSINLLLFSLFIFGIVFLSFDPAIRYFHLNDKYLLGKEVLFILGIANIIEMGTGVNGQIIATSTAWRFEFYTNVILGFVITVLSFVLTKYTQAGIMGPALATLTGLLIYNAIRISFLKKKYKLFPFTHKTVLTIILFIMSVIPGLLLQLYLPGIITILFANIFFVILMALGVVYLELSPDIQSIIINIRKRIKRQ